MVLAGVTGVGKTRLLREAIEMANRSGYPIAHAPATRTAQAMPFGALAPLLPAGAPLEPTGSDRLETVLQRTAAALLENVGRRHLVFFVDDAHLLDNASAALVHHLAISGQACIVLTVRSREPAPDAILALWKEDLLTRIEIDALDLGTVTELVEKVLDGPIDPAAINQLNELSGGRPFFLYELVRGGIDAGALRNDGGIWRLRDRVMPTSRLIEIVESRIRALTEPEQSLLEIIAYGEPLGLGELGSVGDFGLIEPLERAGLLSTALVGRRLEVRLGHPVFGEVLRERVPAIRAREIKRLLADATEATSARRREDNLRIATWRLDVGGGDPSVLLAAAHTCRWRYDFPLAERFANAAIFAGAGFDARLLAAHLAGLQGRGDEELAALGDLARNGNGDAERARATMSLLDRLLFNVSDVDRGLAIAEEAEANFSDPVWRDEIAARRVAIAVITKGFADSPDAVQPLLERTTGPTRDMLDLIVEFSLMRGGRLEDAVDRIDRDHIVHTAHSDSVGWETSGLVRIWCEALSHLGRFGEAHDLAAAQYNAGIRSGSLEVQAFGAWSLSRLVADRGNVSSTLRYAHAAAAIFRDLDRPSMLGYCLIDVATAFAFAGRVDDARAVLAELEGLAVESTAPAVIDLLQAKAWTAARAGDLVEARRILADAAVRGFDLGDLVGAACSLHALARLEAPDLAAATLGELAQRIDGPLIDSRAEHADALLRRDPARLLTVAAAFAEMGAPLLGAEAATDAAGLARRVGARRHWFEGQRLAEALLERCDGASSPALRRSTQSALLLTPREREVAMLAANGWSNKEMARKLTVSVRTIENQLHRIFQKLGIRRREEIVGALEGD